MTEKEAFQKSFNELRVKYGKMKAAVKGHQEALQRSQQRESELEKTRQGESERVLKQVANANAARDKAEKDLESAKASLEEERRASMKWQKKVSYAVPSLTSLSV